MNLQFKQKQKKAGFTLFEVLVSLSIFIIITVIVLFDYSKFNNNVLLTDLAYQVSLSIREAQVYGISVKNAGDTFKRAYGVYFDKNTLDSYLIFADLDDDKSYTPPVGGVPVDQIINTFKLQRGNKIKNVCVTKNTTEHCFDVSTGGSSDVNNLSIIFLRPDPDARFKINKEGGGGYDPSISKATITLVSPKLETKSLMVNTTGQISVNQ